MLLTVAALSGPVLAQDLTIIVDKKGKVGFADKAGNEVIKCVYESAMPFSDGIAIVTKSGKSGIIDPTGKVLLPLKYTGISAWSDNLLLIKDGKNMGLADKQGKIVLKAEYSLITKANCYGKALIALKGKPMTSTDKKKYMQNAVYGIIDNTGSIIITPKYKGLYEFSQPANEKFPFYEGTQLEYSLHYTTDTLKTDCSYLGFNKHGLNIYKSGIMDSNGKEFIKPELYDIVMMPKSGMVRYYNAKKKETICGYHDMETNKGLQVATFKQPIDKLTFWTHGDFVDNMAPVNGESWTFINKTGNVLRSGFSSLKHSTETNFWAARNKDMKWDVFDEKNNDITVLSNYEDIYFPMQKEDKKIFTMRKGDKWGCIDMSGNIVIPFEYENALGNCYDMVIIKKDGKCGVLSSDNKLVIPINYVNVYLPNERGADHYWVMKDDSLFYHLNITIGKLSATGYKAANYFVNGVAFVVPVGMKIENTKINKAQVYAPNTAKAKVVDTVNVKNYASAFGYLMNTEDEIIFDLPVSTLYKDKVLEKIKAYGNRALTMTEKKKILLEVTKENRSYDINSTLDESEWNY